MATSNAATNHAEDLVVNWLLTTGTATRPTSWTVGLFTAVADAEAGTVTEVSGGSYARTAVTFSAASSGATANSADVQFPTASASWGTITHAGVYDNAGNLLFVGELTNSKSVGSGDTFQVSTGSLTISLN
jgi:hypothetical protein